MEEEIFRCEVCERDFKNEDALRMHNSIKHSQNMKKEKVAKMDFRKIKNWFIF